MVVAQLVELTTPEVRRSNPVIGKKIVVNVYCQLYWKDENKEKEAVNCPFFKKILAFTSLFILGLDVH